MLYIILMTYHVDNLVLSLRSCKGFSTPHKLLVHNDNPNCKVSFKSEDIDVFNEDENQGMMDARISSLLYLDKKYEIHEDDLVLFMDDDDILFDFKIPQFNTPKLVTQAMEITTSAQLVDVWSNNTSKIEQYRTLLSKVPNCTIAGAVYKLKEYIEFIKVFINYEPVIKEYLGVNKIFASEDDILDGCYYHYVKLHGEHFAEETDLISVGWNRVESRIGRYNVDDHEYGEGANQAKIDEFQDKFNHILVGFVEWYKESYKHE